MRNLHHFRLLIAERIFKHSITIYEEELNPLFPRQVIDRTIEIFNPRTVLDLGCGTGKSLDYFIAKGIEATGVEGSKLAISKANHPELIIRFNLNKRLNLNRKFDLIWSFEFVEHIHPKYLDNLMNTFSNHSDKIVISAARPGQGGYRHFNEQPPAYWIEQFAKYGYKLNQANTGELRSLSDQYAENILVFER